MKKMIENLLLLAAITGIFVLIPIFLFNATPILVTVPPVSMEAVAVSKQRADAEDEEKAEQEKEAAERAAQEAKYKALVKQVYSCKSDDECIIVDKDPCGCNIGPKGITAINVNAVSVFNLLNKQNTGMKVCPETLSTANECSARAYPACRAGSCKILY